MSVALDLDLQGLVMAAADHAAGGTERATYELFVRELPRGRNYLVAAGFADALGMIEGLRFADEDIRHLRSLEALRGAPASFFERLARFRFSGAVRAVAEGTPVFGGEPLLSVTAPLFEAVLLETTLLSIVTVATATASKAARLASAARGRAVIEFASRRAPGPGAAVAIARAAYLAGCAGTSNVEAGRAFGIPVFGAAAHSWTLACEGERQAFDALLDVSPDADLLLLDTYDVEAAARCIASLSRPVRGVRIDSGDLARLARSVREILDGAGLRSTTITASGEIDEYRIDELVCDGVPIDRFGVGKQLATPADSPALGAVYKLVELDGPAGVRRPAKASPGKLNVPGAKQVMRRFGAAGGAEGDRIVRHEAQSGPGEVALLETVVENGHGTRPTPSLAESRAHALRAIAALPAAVRRLAVPERYPVTVDMGASP